MGTKFATRFFRNLNLWICLALVGLLSCSVNSACSKGCLSCDTASDTCLVCDPFQNYQLDAEKNCVVITVADCEIVDPAPGDPKCLQCKSGMLFDFTQQKCVDVPSNKQVLNCEKYNQAGECVACAQKHYIANGKCAQAAIEVDGCLVFTESNFCSVCEKNKMYNEDTGKCVSFSGESNCASHAFATCDKCLHGYHRELNSVFSFANSQTPNVSSIVFYNTDPSFNGNFITKAISNCLPISYKDCLTYAMTDGKVTGCETCAAGKFLNATTKNCDANPSLQISQCKVYTDSTTCYRCNDNYYLDTNECKAVAEVPDCSVYMRDSDKCEKCIESKYLDVGANQCTARDPAAINGCSTHSTTANECSVCITDYVRTTDKMLCLPKIQYCSEYEDSTKTDTELKCKTCIGKYYPSADQKFCLVQKLDNCHVYETNKNSCQTCLNGYYKSDAEPFTCTKKSIDGCETFSNDQKNECANCKNLYSKSVDNKTCTKLTDTNCAQNDVNMTTCTDCNRGYYLNGSTCESSNKTTDPLCTHVRNDGQCTKCVYGYMPFELLSYLTNLPAGCAAADSSNGNCTQCAEDMDGADDGGVLKCTSAADKTKKCKQLNANVKEALADNDTKCAMCRNPDDHYLTGGTCTDRSPHTRHNCNELNSISDTCVNCNTSTHSFFLSNTDPVCLKPPTVYTIDTIANCLVYDFFNPKKCLKCENNHTYAAGATASDLDTCTAVSGDLPDDWDQYYIDFSDNMKIKQGLYNGGSVIDGCKKHYYSYSNSGIRCGECKTGYTAVVSYSDPASPLLYFTPMTGDMMSASNHVIKECKQLTDADYMQYVQGTALAISANCTAAIKLVGTNVEPDNYICLSCGAGKQGIVKQFDYDKDGATATDWSGTETYERTGYGECSSSTEFSQSYKIFYWANLSEDYKFSFGEIFHDTCSDSTKNVVHIKNSISFRYFLGVEGTKGSERPNMVCQVIPPTGKVDNCQVYSLGVSTDSTRDLALEDTYLCAACKPGYTLTSNTQGEQCLPIENCNLNGPNTWMNACQTCDSGFTWEIDSSSKYPNLSKCNANADSTETDCLLNDSGSNECKLCTNNKTLNTTTKKCEDFPTFCQTNGFPDHDLLSYLTSNILKDAYQTIFLNLFLDNYKLGGGKCSSCTSATKMFMSKDGTDAAKSICVSDDVKTGVIEGCLKTHGLVMDICNECKDDYILTKDNSKCTLRTNSQFDRRCKVAQTSNTCHECFDGLIVSQSGQCLENSHCREKDSVMGTSNKCQRCEWGYKWTSSDNRVCEVIDDDDSMCLSWTFMNSVKTCEKCRDCSQTPVRKIISSNESNVHCINNQSSYNLDQYLVYYQLENDNHKIKFDAHYSPVPSGKFVTTNFPDSSDMPQYVCVRTPMDPNCTSYDATNKYECTACGNWHYLDTNTKTCMKGTLTGCKEYTNKTTCNICDNVPTEANQWKSYYRSGSSCILHTVTNCESYSSTSNACIHCKNGYHKDNNSCKPNVIATNCKKSVTDTDQCTTCSPNYYKSDWKCKEYTVSNCEGFSSTSNACTSCKDNFYLSNSNCIANTAPNCATKSKTSNECLTCTDSNQYKNGSQGCLTQPTIETCKVYRTSGLGCDECNDGYYEKNDECHANPSGLANCTAYSDATTCTACASTHFLDGAVCTEVTNQVSGCVLYSANGVCSVCGTNQIKSESGDTCTDAVELTCATWTDTENCATCSGNNVLKTNADSKVQCVASGIDHCLTPVAGTPNACTACADGFILRDSTCVAPKVSITNCRVYDEPTENCVECYSGNVLSADKTKCLSKIAEAGDFCALAHIKSDENPSCSLCEFGYSQNGEGKCEQCGGEGCFVCDTSDLTKCKVCKSEYFMSSSSTCSLNDPPAIESVSALQALFTAFLILLFTVE